MFKEKDIIICVDKDNNSYKKRGVITLYNHYSDCYDVLFYNEIITQCGIKPSQIILESEFNKAMILVNDSLFLKE